MYSDDGIVLTFADTDELPDVGDLFPEWRGDGFVSGLSSQALIRVEFDGVNAREAERFRMGERIRAVVEGPDGALWLLEDGRGGRLLKLTPRG